MGERRGAAGLPVVPVYPAGRKDAGLRQYRTLAEWDLANETMTATTVAYDDT